ncbi:hypothetical protein [Finegoldia magna]|uniref:hypothetical protein n=1 Tax=Finegoldia magna TaxID=1260 RepID=UPI003F7EBB95
MGENLNKLKDLNENYKSLQALLEAYNPWTYGNISKLSKDFFEALKNEDKDFSWLNIDSYDKKKNKEKKDKEKKDLHEELKDKKGKAVSIDYGIPSHVRGDIEKGTVFLCLVNPNIDVKVAMCESVGKQDKEDIKKYIFDISSKGGILYKEIVELKGLKKLIGLEESDKDKNQEKNKIGYYTANYFYVILSAINDYKSKDEKEYEDLKKAVKSFETFISNLEENDDKKPTNEEKEVNKESLTYFVERLKNIVNLEAFPFRSSTPNFAIDEDNAKDRFANCLVNSNSNVSMLSARIIIWKILEYINNPKDNVKPVFIFRRFNRAWRPSIENVLRKDFVEKYKHVFIEKNKNDFSGKNKDDLDEEKKAINIAIDNIIDELHEEFFYTIGPKDQDNMLKMSKNIYKENVNIYNKKEKRNEFNKRISDALSLQKDKKENK